MLYLVELQCIKKVKKLAVLLAVLQLGVVLLQAVEREFCLIIHKHFHGLQEQKNSNELHLLNCYARCEKALQAGKACGRNTTFTTYVLHELATDWSDLLAQSCTEHHDLLLVGCDLEDFLHVTPHVWCKKIKMGL